MYIRWGRRRSIVFGKYFRLVLVGGCCRMFIFVGNHNIQDPPAKKWVLLLVGQFSKTFDCSPLEFRKFSSRKMIIYLLMFRITIKLRIIKKKKKNTSKPKNCTSSSMSIDSKCYLQTLPILRKLFNYHYYHHRIIRWWLATKWYGSLYKTYWTTECW